MKQGLCLVFAMFLIFSGSSVLAQEKEPEPVVADQPSQPSEPVKVKKKKAIFLDIPLLPFERSVDIGRIQDRSVNLGTLRDPWEDQISVVWPNPSVRFEGVDYAGDVSGGFSYSDDGVNVRSNKSFNFSGEESLGGFLFGIGGFVEQEKALSIINGIQFNADFERLSYGSRGWGGAKFGDLNDRYLAIRVGGGYIWTESQEVYIASFRDVGPLPLYDDQYRTFFVATDGRIDFLKRFSYRMRVEKSFYEKVFMFWDENTYGLNRFDDLAAEGSLEAVPLLRADRLRFVLKGRFNFDREDELLFKNSPSSVQLLLRIKLK